jgi:cellulose biosynthesis protein BcsQ
MSQPNPTPEPQKRRGRTLAVANMKGGVGKTTAVVALAEAFAALRQARVLVIDLDAQANASLAILGDQRLTQAIENEVTIRAFLEDSAIGGGAKPITRYIQTHASDVSHMNRQLALDVIACEADFRLSEREIIYRLTEAGESLRAIENRFTRTLRPSFETLESQYDWILVDCPPGISAVTEVSLRVASMVITPVIPDFLSTLGLEAFCRQVMASVHRGEVGTLRRPHVLASRVKSTRQHQGVLEALRDTAKGENAEFHLIPTVLAEKNAFSDGIGKTGSAPTFTDKWGDDNFETLYNLVCDIEEALA